MKTTQKQKNEMAKFISTIISKTILAVIQLLYLGDKYTFSFGMYSNLECNSFEKYLFLSPLVEIENDFEHCQSKNSEPAISFPTNQI